MSKFLDDNILIIATLLFIILMILSFAGYRYLVLNLEYEEKALFIKTCGGGYSYTKNVSSGSTRLECLSEK